MAEERGYDAKNKNQKTKNNFILALSGKEAFYGRWLSGNESACNAGDMDSIPI